MSSSRVITCNNVGSLKWSENIPAGSVFNIHGTGSITINGNIGDNVIINNYRTGALKFKGTIGANVIFNNYGIGSVTGLNTGSSRASTSTTSVYSADADNLDVSNLQDFILSSIAGAQTNYTTSSSSRSESKAPMGGSEPSSSSSSNAASRTSAERKSSSTSSTANLHGLFASLGGLNINVPSGQAYGSGSVKIGKGAIVGGHVYEEDYVSRGTSAQLPAGFDPDAFGNQLASYITERVESSVKATTASLSSSSSTGNVTVTRGAGSALGGEHVNIPAGSIVGTGNVVHYRKSR